MTCTDDDLMKHPDWDGTLALARHEAGHYVVNRVLGFSPGDITLQIKGPSGRYGESSIWIPHATGHCFVELDEELTSMIAVAEWLDRRIQALFAGALAQSMERASDTPDAEVAGEILLKANGADDLKVIKAFVLLARNIACPMLPSPEERETQKQRIHQQNWDAAIVLVKQEAEVIHDLALVVARRSFGSSSASDADEGVLTKDRIELLGCIQQRFGPMPAH